MRKFWGIEYKAGRRLDFYCFFMRCLKVKGRKDKGYWIQLLGIPLFKISEKTFLKIVNKIITKNNFEDYVHYLNKTNSTPSNTFVPITDTPFQRQPDDPGLIAFYLPQYHSIPLNDQNFGKGFTDWSNVTKAIPHFVGHYQPHLPIDVGFYNLDHVDVMYRQVELAKIYGIHAFCFHYYWFSGERLLEKPLFNYLNHKDLSLPFCLCWANENWSKLWDGGNKEVVIANKHLDNDCEHFFEDILPFFKDNRYIKIDGKPLLVVYRPHLLGDKCQKWVNVLRQRAKEAGFPGIFLLSPYAYEDKTPADFFFDGFLEFPPRNTPCKQLHVDLVNNKSIFTTFDMADYVDNKVFEKEVDFKLFKGVFPSWDNTARKAYTGGNIFLNLTPSVYKRWLSSCLKWTKENRSKSEQFVFINAWNEWAEGAHLEPDQRYGYAYLEATKEALEEQRTD